MAGTREWGWRHERRPAVRRERRRRARARLSLSVAAAAVTAAALFALSGLFTDATRSVPPAASWSSARGLRVRSDYLTGCEQAGSGGAYCGCLFDRITARLPYSTPGAFVTLELTVRRARRSGDEAGIPAVLTEASDACATPTPTITGRSSA
ncbi:MAG TPA: hypothetical protein VL977_02730 [Solirubrobacteraceae bacterium]|nr:hypothetical protein [Solirubrobacteraceae bacterium]